MTSFTVKVSDRSMRRVQIVMAAVQAADQTAKAASDAAAGMVAQARKSLDEALGSICDAHDEMLPEDYTVTLHVKNGDITITDNRVEAPVLGAIIEPANGKDQSLVHARTQGDEDIPSGLSAYKSALEGDAP